ncbi:allantoicase Ecym_1126 [Eremothecium cymbalariae DBVPG|uniref:allantoicase n=1 Tax=Eremothecium cymbalariae (strain CBS 270.75 / DBVPG 7215 / KCTC 17166 / NRRL Y-17582) TaxID=931890 RepID=G8JMM4_ERECY|nr:hypothetical protein Ecym_1126 [Eremothecium cymbalariae DBVPG\
MTEAAEISQFSKKQAEEFRDLISSGYSAVDVVSMKLGGVVVSCSDEWFGEANNLLKACNPIRESNKFTPAGAWYDGWETRRHNQEEYDWVIIKMGVASAKIVGCEVDTAFFNGNHAPFISVEALFDTGSDFIKEKDPRWVEVINKTECGPSQQHFLLRSSPTNVPYTHVKLKMYPDGGIARFRLYGKVVPFEISGPENGIHDLSMAPIINLSSVCQGAIALRASDQHFGVPENLLLSGRGCDMSDGWETKRSRTPNHVDWVVIKLGRRSTFIQQIVVDTAHFRGNFPQYIEMHGIYSDEIPAHDDPQWQELVPQAKTGPDAEHVYTINSYISLTHVKLTIIPDGGVKRVGVWGF